MPPSNGALLALNDIAHQRADGVVVIKARSTDPGANREDALERLAELIRSVAKVQKARRPTNPTRGSQKRRLDGKAKRGAVKAGRGKVDF